MKSEKDTHMGSPTHGSKVWYKWTYWQNRKTHRHRKQTYGYQRGRGVYVRSLGLTYTHYYI